MTTMVDDKVYKDIIYLYIDIYTLKTMHFDELFAIDTSISCKFIISGTSNKSIKTIRHQY